MHPARPAVQWPLTLLAVGSPTLCREDVLAPVPGVRVRWTQDALQALLLLDAVRPGAVLVPTDVQDVPLARLVGQVRDHRDVPILVALAGGPGTAGAAAAAVGAGASAVLDLPVGPQQLQAALSAAAREERGGPGDRILVGEVTVDLGGHCVVGPDGRAVLLSTQQLATLCLLGRAWPALVPVERIATHLGLAGELAAERTRRAVARLRRQLALAGVGAGFVQNVRGVGYRLDPDRARVHVPGRERLSARGRS